MTSYKIPVHILYDDEAIKTEDLQEVINKLLKNLIKTTPALVNVLLSVFKMGESRGSLEQITRVRTIIARIEDPQNIHRRVDLRGALAQVYYDYKQIGSQRRLIFIITGSKISAWKDVYEKFDSERLPVLIHLFWVYKKEQNKRPSDESKYVKSEFQNTNTKTNILKDPKTLSSELLEGLEKTINEAIQMAQLSGEKLSKPIAGFALQSLDASAVDSHHKATSREQVDSTPSQKQTKIAGPVSSSRIPERSQDKLVEPIKDPLTQAEAELPKPITQSGDQAVGNVPPFTDQKEPAMENGQTQKPPPKAESAHSKTIAQPQNQPVEQVPSDVDKIEPVAEPEQKPPPPPPKPARWEYYDPPKDIGDRKAHKYTQFSKKPCAYGWYMLCASRRGRLHEHEATFREDAVRIDSGNNWHLIAVADGAGSANLSRLGSELVVDAAIKEMRAYVKSQVPSAAVARVACQEALEAAWTALYKTAEERQIPFKDLATTLLLLAYHPQLNIVGYAQVGDGLIVAQKDDGELVQLGEPESGEYSGQTYFMTNYKHNELASKSKSLEANNPLRLFFVMSDGVSDDLYPPLERVMGLITPMPKVLTSKDPGEALYDLIGYERAGSFDDRTLAVLCHKESVIQKTPPPPPKEEKEVDKKGVEEDAKLAASAEKAQAPRIPDVVDDEQGGTLPGGSPELKPESEMNQGTAVDHSKQTPPVDDPRSTEEPDSLKTKGAPQGGILEDDQKDLPLSK